MTILIRTLIAVALLAAALPSQSRPSVPDKKPASRAASRPMWMEEPDDRYAKLLAGKKLEDGKGFPGVVVIGDHLGDAMKKIGNGREDFDWVFWYFYDKGNFKLTVCTDFMTRQAGGARITALIIEGEGAPPTSKGIKVGDPTSKVIAAYGPSQRFNGALVGRDRIGRKRTTIHFGSGDEKDSVIADPPEFKDALFFPAAKLLVAVEKDKVLKLAIVEEEDSLPEFLQPPEKIGKALPPGLKIDPSVKFPTPAPAGQSGFLIPPAPELVEYKAAGWTTRVPVGWTLSDDVWTDSSGFESVMIQTMKADPQESSQGALFAMLEIAREDNLLPKWRCSIPDSFCKMVGATEGACAVTVAEGKGKEGFELRSYRLLLTKGGRRYLIVVTRTQHPRRIEREGGGFSAHAFMGCPDGDALARGVMRSFRITQ